MSAGPGAPHGTRCTCSICKPAPLDHIQLHANGGASLVGPKAVNVMRLATLASGLKLEMRCPGMKLSRVGSALKFAKLTTGLRTNDRQKQLERIEIMLEQARREVVYITPEDAGN